MAEIRDHAAWERGKQNRILANANTRRRRELDEAVAQDSELFRFWLLGSWTTELRELWAAVPETDSYGESSECEAAHEYEHALRRRVGFAPDFLRDALNEWGGLTPKQLELARKIFAEREEKALARETAEAARRANATPWTSGRQVVSGVVQSARYETFTDNYGRACGGAVKALLLLDDGRKLWTSLPAASIAALNPQGARTEAVKGQRFTFKVTVTPSDDDPTMGFGKRPTPVKEAE